MKEFRKPLLKALIAVWALSDGSFSLLLSGHAVDVPLIKYFFTVVEQFDGSDLRTMFLAIGIGVCFCLVRNRQKNLGVSGLAFSYAVCTIVGISYDKTGSWNYIFLFGTQFLMALFVGTGYYFLYKNFILLLQYLYESKEEWFRFDLTAAQKVSMILFEKHPFWGPLIFLMLCGMPWIVAFCPGTLQWDAHAQLWMGFGVIEQTSYHPVFITNYMTGCVKAGRILFHSDSFGLFFFTFPQFLAQCSVFSYALYTMKQWRCPVIVRWGALLFWGVFPYFQIWGFTMVKDTAYYIGFVLYITVIFHTVYEEKNGKEFPTPVTAYSVILFILGIALVVYARNDGRYVIGASLLCFLVVYRKKWKLWLFGLLIGGILLFAEEKIYMPVHGIDKGPMGEMLSIPLQQTARYLRDHYEEVTEEERKILQAGFDVDLSEIGVMYNGVISDPVKGHFVKNPDGEYLKAYIRVWASQLIRHPDTYIQAFLNHIYGYFYPQYPDYGDYLTVTYLGNSDHWKDEALEFEFFIKNGAGRDILRHITNIAERMPVISLLYNTGSYTYIVMAITAALMKRKRGNMLWAMLPIFMVILICLASPVNGYMRYMMPVMAACPLLVAWCHVKEYIK